MAAKKSKNLAQPTVPQWLKDKEAARKAAKLQRVLVLVEGRKRRLEWRINPNAR